MKAEAESWSNAEGMGLSFCIRSPFPFHLLQPGSMDAFYREPWLITHPDLPETRYKIGKVEAAGCYGTIPEGARIRIYVIPAIL